MQEQIDSRDFAELLVFYELEPWGLADKLIGGFAMAQQPIEPNTDEEMIGPLVAMLRARGARRN